jgi:hydroxymethylglutaryl-CoA lyase
MRGAVKSVVSMGNDVMLHEEPQILIEENSPRDGLQNESIIFSIADRVALINALARCGLKRIQIGSFVNPGRVPQMAGTEEVFRRIERRPDVVYTALILNRKGFERAAGCGINHLSLFVSASESHSWKNSRCSVDDALAAARELIREAKDHGLGLQAGVMNAFGCRFEGEISMARVMEMVRVFDEEGADEINLADTSGVAHPVQVEIMIAAARSCTDRPLALHLHDTYGFALANAYVAWKSGVRRFDASCGGLGGCPFIPGASGNIPTEDLVCLFESMGVGTGVDLKSTEELVLDLEKKLGRRLPGHLAHVGLSPFLDKCLRE